MDLGEPWRPTAACATPGRRATRFRVPTSDVRAPCTHTPRSPTSHVLFSAVPRAGRSLGRDGAVAFHASPTATATATAVFVCFPRARRLMSFRRRDTKADGGPFRRLFLPVASRRGGNYRPGVDWAGQVNLMIPVGGCVTAAAIDTDPVCGRGRKWWWCRHR